MREIEVGIQRVLIPWEVMTGPRGTSRIWVGRLVLGKELEFLIRFQHKQRHMRRMQEGDREGW